MKTKLKIICEYVLVFLLFSAVYILSFHTPLFLKQKVLFYRGVKLLLVVSSVFLGAVFLIHKRIKMNLERVLASLVVSISLNLSIFILLPVTFDRSVTTFLLKNLAVRKSKTCKKGLTKENLTKDLINNYVLKNKAIERRVYEQTQIGLIQTEHNCLYLSPAGLRFISISQLVKKLYNADR